MNLARPVGFNYGTCKTGNRDYSIRGYSKTLGTLIPEKEKVTPPETEPNCLLVWRSVVSRMHLQRMGALAAVVLEGCWSAAVR